MITLIHGENIGASRSFLLEQKQKITSPLVFDGEKLTLTDIIQAVSGGGLFSDTKTIFIEEFLTKRKPSKEYEQIVLAINTYAGHTYIWEGKEVTKKQLGLFPKAKIEIFTYPKILFTFLSAITPSTKQEAMRLFHELLKQQEEAAIFYMIIRQMRLLLAARDTQSQETIDELQFLPPWAKKKTTQQSIQFSKEQLIALYDKLYAIEVGQKTGTLTISVSQALDFWLLDL